MNKLVSVGNTLIQFFFSSFEDALLQWPVFDSMKVENLICSDRDFGQHFSRWTLRYQTSIENVSRFSLNIQGVAENLSLPPSISCVT